MDDPKEPYETKTKERDLFIAAGIILIAILLILRLSSSASPTIKFTQGNWSVVTKDLPKAYGAANNHVMRHGKKGSDLIMIIFGRLPAQTYSIVGMKIKDDGTRGHISVAPPQFSNTDPKTLFRAVRIEGLQNFETDYRRANDLIPLGKYYIYLDQDQRMFADAELTVE